MGRQDGGKDIAAIGREGIAVSGIDLADQAVSTKHAEHARDFGRASAFFFGSISERIEEEGLEIAIPEAVDGELATGNGLKKLGVFLGPGAQGADPLVVIDDGLTDAANQLAERGRGINGSQGVEVAEVGGLRDLGAAREIGDAFAHGEPVFLA